MPNLTVLAFDVGGTKTAWGVIDEQATIHEHGEFTTPHDREAFLKELTSVVKKHDKVSAIGIGIAGTVSADHHKTLVCTNIPELSHLDLAEEVKQVSGKPLALDNDGRCALIGEVWQGAAQDISGCVLITIGTGVGGAVMQRRQILPHPVDLSLEISHLMADPIDLYPARSGKGTVEALIGGRNIEDRYGISLAELARYGRAGKPDALEVWSHIQEAFLNAIRAIHETYACSQILVGGKGADDLPLYMGENQMPCPVIPAKLGGKAGLLGAARIALDAAEEDAKDWDED